MLSTRDGAEISPSSACCHLSPSVEERCPWFWISAAWSEHRGSSHREFFWGIFAGWLTGWSSLDFVSAGSVCKRQTSQSLSRQGAPRPVCFRAVTCDSVIYKGMGGLEAWIHPLDGYKTWRWLGMDGISPLSRSMISVILILLKCVSALGSQWHNREDSWCAVFLQPKAFPLLSALTSSLCFNIHTNALWMCIQWDVVWKERLIPAHERPTHLCPVFPRSRKASQSEWVRQWITERADCIQWTERSCLPLRAGKL